MEHNTAYVQPTRKDPVAGCCVQGTESFAAINERIEYSKVKNLDPWSKCLL